MIRAIFQNMFSAWSWWRQLLLFGGLMMVILGILAWVNQKRMSHSERMETRTAIAEASIGLSPQTQYELEILKQTAYDRFHLKERLVVRNGKLLHWRLDNVMGGELQFEFEVFNGSIFPSVKVGCSIDGYLMVHGTRFHDKTEIQSSVNIVHGCWNNVVIIQRVLPEVVKEISESAISHDGVILRFDFEGVKIYAEEEGSKQGLNQQNILSLPKTMKFRVKYEAGFYSWQPLYDINIS